MKLRRGDQIVYVPSHAKGDVRHRDADPGFVTSVNGDVVFCRYWSKHTPGELRTKANSEGTPIGLLVRLDTRPQVEVEEMLMKIEGGGLWDS